jgi:hypothetical protein
MKEQKSLFENPQIAEETAKIKRLTEKRLVRAEELKQLKESLKQELSAS